LVPRTRILIVCEGAKTEPNYFRKFPYADVFEVEVVGAGRNTDSLVEEAVRLRDVAERDGVPFNEVWCVFDRDSFTPQEFNRARQIALNEHIRPAMTNEAFELWYLLHFNFHDAGISRKTYGDRLTVALKQEYRKNMPNAYELLLALQPDAIRNATTLLRRYPWWNPEAHNPSTNVHLLVLRLNELAE
jgi:hypothetical protein